MKNFKSFKQFVKDKTSFVVEFARIEGHLVRTGRIEKIAHGWQLLGVDKSGDDVFLKRGSNRKELEKFAKHHKIKIAPEKKKKFTIREYITEVFDKPYKWRGGNVAKGSITPDNKNAIEEYTFKTSDGGTIELNVNHFWGVRRYTGHTIAIEFIKRDAQYGHPTYAMTGEGDALKILATVLDIIKSIIKKHEPTTIMFSADKGQDNRKTGTKEPTGRTGAYGAIVKRFAGKLGYKSDTNDTGRDVRWQLTKK